MDEKDYGTEYLKSLGLRPVKTERAFYGRLEKHISKDWFFTDFWGMKNKRREN